MDIPSTPGGVATLPLDLSAGMDSLHLAIDANNDGTTDQTQSPTSILDAQQSLDSTMPATAISIQGSHNSAGVYSGQVSVTLTPTDKGVGVYETKYSLYGGKTWQTYTFPVNFNARNTPIFYAYSVDKAGNSEYPYKVQEFGHWFYLPNTAR